MFRLKEANLPADPTYPADLNKLGFFVNAAGQFRLIEYPDKNFGFHYTNDERHNEVRREAFQVCQRREVAKRLSALGLQNLHLPQLTYTKPEEASVPILAPPAEVLKTRKRVIVLVNDTSQDLGILAYRRLQRELGVNGGSVINFAKQLVKRSTEPKEDFDLFKDGVGVADKDTETPGLVVLNCGQLVYSYKYATAMSLTSWVAMPRRTASHDTVAITAANHIKDNEDAKSHVRFAIENVIHNPDFVSKDAEIYLIGIENGAEYIIDVIDKDFKKYGSRITAMAFVNPMISSAFLSDDDFKKYLHERARMWKISSVSNDPHECVEAPSQHLGEVEITDSSAKVVQPPTPTPVETAKSVSWLETLPSSSVLSTVNDLLGQLSLSPTYPQLPKKVSSDDANSDWQDDMDPICPSFADDENPYAAGECIFTSDTVQHAILEFFEEVAQNPKGFRNPIFKAKHTVNESTMDQGWGDEEVEEVERVDQLEEIKVIEPLDKSYDPLQVPHVEPEHIELNEKKEELENMKAAIRDTPTDQPELQAGRAGLEKRVVKMEEEIAALARKVLATGGMKAGEAEDLRENWTRVGGGPKIMFAGTMVDSELVKGAGMEETADAELAALEKEMADEE